MEARMLAPAAVLVLWSIVMLFWMGFARLPAIGKMGGLGNAKPGGRGQDLEGVLPDPINWKAHNYTHLLEQPTLFYATVVILAIVGPSNADIAMAWGYVGLRVIHSLWQAMVNTVSVRFTLFLLSTACLIGLAGHAAVPTLWP